VGKTARRLVLKELGGVGVDRNDNVYVFNRGEHPMIVFDRAGNFLRSWGEGQYPRPHGVHMAPDDTMFLTDDGGHFVRKVSLDGKVLLELGVPGKPAPFMSGVRDIPPIAHSPDRTLRVTAAMISGA
jgi:hypothetical protein